MLVRLFSLRQLPGRFTLPLFKSRMAIYLLKYDHGLRRRDANVVVCRLLFAPSVGAAAAAAAAAATAVDTTLAQAAIASRRQVVCVHARRTAQRRGVVLVTGLLENGVDLHGGNVGRVNPYAPSRAASPPQTWPVVGKSCEAARRHPLGAPVDQYATR